MADLVCPGGVRLRLWISRKILSVPWAGIGINLVYKRGPQF